MNSDDRKIFDKEYIYLNTLANIVLTKIKFILAFVFVFFFISLIITYFLNQNLYDEYKWTIEYNEPTPTYNVKKIIKSIDKIERKLGYNVGRYHYNPSYVIFNNFYNFLEQNNEKKVFESNYKLANIIENKTIEIRHRFYLLEIFENMRLTIEIVVNDEQISKDYVKKFKKFYEIEFINQIKEFYPELIKERYEMLKNEFQNEKLNASINIQKLIYENQIDYETVDINSEIIKNYQEVVGNSIIEKYELLNKDLNIIETNIKKEDFNSLFLNSKISPNYIIMKKKISFLTTGFLSIVFGFTIFSLLFIYLEYRKNISKI